MTFAPAAAPRQVLLFSGHMVDAPGRAAPRLPPDRLEAAVARIAAVLDDLGAGPGDIALSEGAAGGDILFGEACVARGVALQWLLPLPEPAFVRASVLPVADGASWRMRYDALRARLAVPPRIAEAELGPLPAGMDPWERGNLWLLETALGFGADKLHLIVLWDGGGGDGPGGTRHMVDEARRLAGQVHVIDTRSLGTGRN